MLKFIVYCILYKNKPSISIGGLLVVFILYKNLIMFFYEFNKC